MKALLDSVHSNLVLGRRVRRLVAALSECMPPHSRVLDVGCGDGQISKLIAERTGTSEMTGLDVLIRPATAIPVIQFDGQEIPQPDDSYDVVMFVDVLHHTDDPEKLLREARRVSRKYLLVKDHLRDGLLAGTTLRLMDWVGNFHHGVRLPYNYLSEQEWNGIFARVGLNPVKSLRRLGLYPGPADALFGRGLHFVTLLEITTPMDQQHVASPGAASVAASN